ncbi:hypothetical protein [Gordonia aquimaris]|uniref:Uncharacterized protein n=1 Tax=Gordonia aquimaris TaxID=2984863 RepID=A0A9X3I6V0_9ACTN|nr:hypothetical protein [Gordonia aquimaris]MCX2967242.1 hypothetical protein [Gordonia aquimaris]
MNSVGAHRPISRRAALSPIMAARLSQDLVRVTADVHARRIKEWAATDHGPYPSVEESRMAAEAELAQLVRALGSIAEIEPGRFDADVAAATRLVR